MAKFKAHVTIGPQSRELLLKEKGLSLSSGKGPASEWDDNCEAISKFFKLAGLPREFQETLTTATEHIKEQVKGPSFLTQLWDSFGGAGACMFVCTNAVPMPDYSKPAPRPYQQAVKNYPDAVIAVRAG